MDSTSSGCQNCPKKDEESASLMNGVELEMTKSCKKMDSVESDSGLLSANSKVNGQHSLSLPFGSSDPEVICIEADDSRHEQTQPGRTEVIMADKEETKNEKSPTRASKACQVCQDCQAKYTCPGCDMRTCSVVCVKEHKNQSGCLGERNKHVFVDISQYTTGHLLNDYRFLEDAERRLFSNTLAPSSHRRQPVRWAPYHVNRRCKLLQEAAYKRGVSVRFVSPALSRSKCNRSFFTIISDTIDWHVDWLFSATNTLVKDEKVPETTVLVEAARKFTNFVEHPHLRKSLEDYREDRLDSSRFLIKVDCLPANRTRYLSLKPALTLAENLKGLCLIEYPTIVVVAATDKQKFTLLAREDMASMEISAARHILQHRPELNPAIGVEKQLLDPTSDLYKDDSSDGSDTEGQGDKREETEGGKMERADKIRALLDNLKSFSGTKCK